VQIAAQKIKRKNENAKFRWRRSPDSARYRGAWLTGPDIVAAIGCFASVDVA